MVLVLASGDVDVPATDLNAAAEDEHISIVTLRLETAQGEIHKWANGLSLTLTPAEDATDADIGVPAASVVTSVDGVWQFTVTADTDAGSTKTYAATDEYSVAIQIAADDKLFGHAVAEVTKTFVVS